VRDVLIGLAGVGVILWAGWDVYKVVRMRSDGGD
jgi:hypothetical protein